MITITSLTDGACKVDANGTKFEVFPKKVQKDTWTLLPNPEENLTNEKVVSWPGEYDFGGISVRALGQQDGKQVSYACVAEAVCVAFVGAPVLEWSDTDIEKLGEVDVLVVAAADPKKVQVLIEEIDPRMVVLFEVEKGDLAGVAKACGLAKIDAVKDVKIKKSGLPQDTREVVVLK